MTHLRYFIPIVKNLPGCEHYFWLDLKCGKYNAISRHSKKLEEIVNLHCPYIKYYNHGDVKNFDKIITVENFTKIPSHVSFQKRICIQHGLDYFNTDQKKQKKNYPIEYISHDSIYSVPFNQHVPKIPITFWDINGFNEKESKNKVLIFYPETGNHKLVERIVQYLKEKGREVIIKQRKKWQAVPKNLEAKILYDNDWYPSESIVEPYHCHFSIGFNTTAYTDLIPLGIPFIDNCIEKTRFKYIKPKSHLLHSHHESFLENTKKSIDFFLKQEFTRNIISKKEIENFLYKLIHA